MSISSRELNLTFHGTQKWDLMTSAHSFPYNQRERTLRNMVHICSLKCSFQYLNGIVLKSIATDVLGTNMELLGTNVYLLKRYHPSDSSHSFISAVWWLQWLQNYFKIRSKECICSNFNQSCSFFYNRK